MTPAEFDLLLQLRVPHETIERLRTFVALLDRAAETQNLIAAGSRASLWQRHIIDSLQLLPIASSTGSWLDIGTGAGFPGLVIAIAEPHRAVTLSEPRALRAAFLRDAAAALSLDHVDVRQSKVQNLHAAPFAVISARAVAPLTSLIQSGTHVSDEQTCWVLPKGRTARSELDQAAATWQGDFRLVPSLTDPDAAIVIARGLKRRAKR